MKFLLDTNAVSEWVKPRPDAGLAAWLADVDEDRVFISVVTLAELRHGVARLSEGRRRGRLERWLSDDLPHRFEGRVVPVDEPVAHAWGVIVAARDARGIPIGPMDAFIAATAHVHEMTIVTRNTADFSPSLDAVISPWLE